jgi:hypothetical protein
MPEYWRRKLSHPVVPLGGPLRATRTLGEARQTLAERLPAECRERAAWRRATALVLAAGASGSRQDIREATNQLMRALDAEGWLR